MKLKIKITKGTLMNNYCNEVKKEGVDFSNLNFDRQIKSNWDNPLELYLITEALCMMGRFHEAIKTYSRIILLAPEWIDIIELSARAYWAIHEYQLAVDTWKKYLLCRQEKYQRLGINQNVYTIDHVFTQSFGNYGFLFPILERGYLSENDKFFYHPSLLPEVDNINNKNLISNYCLFDLYKYKIGKNVTSDILEITKIDDQITRLPFYCGIDSKRNPTHFQNAFAENLLLLEKKGLKLNKNPSLNEKYINIFKDNDIDLNKKFITLHVRESGYWARHGDKTHSTKNADVFTYMDAIHYLINEGFQVIRIGDSSMKKLPEIPGLFDYAHSKIKSDEIDIYLLQNATFIICTCSGPFQVTGLFNTPILATNWIPVHILPYSKNDIVLLKKLKYKNSQKFLTFSEILKLDFAEFSYYNLKYKGIEVKDNSSDEILLACKKMIDKISSNTDKKINYFSNSISKYVKSRFNFGNKRVISEADILLI